MVNEDRKYFVNIFKSCRDPKVTKEISIDEILEMIKTRDLNKDLIIRARNEGKGRGKYDKIKTSMLPTFTPNSTFYSKRNKKDYKSLSGLLYLDMDGNTTIDLENPLIFSTWLSLSGAGRGILVKVDGINDENIKQVYENIAEELDIIVDHNCKDITRQVVISYDPDIYINEDSTTYIYTKNNDSINSYKNIPHSLQLEKKEKEECKLKGGVSKNIHWNNLHLVDLEGKDYIEFEEKINFSRLIIPKSIPDGRRNRTITATAFQYAALNPKLPLDRVNQFIDVLNSLCTSPLPAVETDRIKYRLQKEIEEGTLEPIPNHPRRFVFADHVSAKQRQSIAAKRTAEIRRENTIRKIQECLDDWDLNEGKVTNKKIAEKTDFAKKTIDRYSKEFRDQKAYINKMVKED